MIRVNPWVAIRYVEDHHLARASATDPLQLRVKECPICGNSKWAVAFHGDRQVFHSFCCGNNTSLLDQVRVDLGVTSLREAMQALARYGETKLLLDLERQPDKARLTLLRERLDLRVGLVQFTERAIALDGYRGDWSSADAAPFLAYAKRRAVPDWFIRPDRLMFATRGFMHGRIVFLVVEDGVPVYAVGRAIDDAVPKYLTLPSARAQGIGAGDVVFNLDLCSPGEILLVCEGALSALSAGGGGVAIFGRTLSETQARKIARAEPAAAVLLREEGVDPVECEMNAMLLRSVGVQTFIAPLLRGDTNDDPDQLPEVLELAFEATRKSALLNRMKGKINID